MKKLCVILNVVLIGMLVFIACNNKTKQQGETPPVTQPTQPDNCNNVCMDYSSNPDYTILEAAVVRAMARDYRNTPNLPDNDAHSVWFELDAMKKFIWNIEKSICAQNCNARDLKLGVRIYYARYPQTGEGAPEPFADLPEEYSGKHTVFMVPTYEVRSNANQDFYMDKPFANCTPIGIPADGPTDPIGLLMPLGKNHGALCPPVCDGAAFEN